MVIAHVIDSLEVGGAEIVVGTLCRLQMAAGHSVEVHCLFGRGSLADGLDAAGVPVTVHGPAGSFAVVRTLYRCFRRSRPDVVHCHNKAATVRGALVGRLTGASAVVSTRHGMAALPYRLRQDLTFWVMAAIFCDRVVAVCEVARKNMAAGARLVAHKLITIRNGAYPTAPATVGGSAKSGFTLVSVGRLATVKNYQALLRSVALARQRVPDLVLWLVGDGLEGPALKRLAAELGIAEHVQFWGERRDVGPWLRGADVFVLSSLSEGLPISLLEAMAAGLPVIVTDVGGMPEVVGLSRAGTVVSAGSIEKLAAAIIDLAERRHDLAELGKRAALCYEQYFTPERMAHEYLGVYGQFVRPQASST